MLHKGFYADITEGQPVYRCCSCPFNTYDPSRIAIHQKIHHPAIGLPDEVQDCPILEGKTIAIGLLTWNTVNISILAARQIVTEIHFLRSKGVRPLLVWADNGSQDRTQAELRSIFEKSIPGVGIYHLNSSNLGQSKARNQIIGSAVTAGADFLLLVDGDLILVPCSTYSMAAYLSTYPTWNNLPAGCLGMLSGNCTRGLHDPDLSQSCTAIPFESVHDDPLIAWTQYGMFSARLFTSGCQFDEKGPFSIPGWGLEDDDFGLQMASKGFISLHTNLFRYYHLRNSSWEYLGGRTSVTEGFQKRREYMIGKWTGSYEPRVQTYIRRLAGMNVQRPAATV